MFIINKKIVRIHTNIDLELKELFESYQTLHKKGFNDALDWGVRYYLKNINNIDIVKDELKENSKEKDQLMAMEAKFKDLERVLNEQNKEKLSDEDELELERSNALKTLLKKPYKLWTAPNRHHAREVGKFKTTEELKKWVQKKQ